MENTLEITKRTGEGSDNIIRIGRFTDVRLVDKTLEDNAIFFFTFKDGLTEGQIADAIQRMNAEMAETYADVIKNEYLSTLEIDPETIEAYITCEIPLARPQDSKVELCIMGEGVLKSLGSSTTIPDALTDEEKRLFAASALTVLKMDFDYILETAGKALLA